MEDNKIIFFIIIGASIIGAFIYFGIRNNNQKAEISFAPEVQQSTPIFKKDSLPSTAVCGADNNLIVTKVIDGDTVVVEGGYHIRLLGMDADEKGYPCYEAAKGGLENLVLGKMIRLEKDKTDVDQYGRCLRYIFLGSTNIDIQLVADGLAVARFYEPDVKYKTEISGAEKQAETSGIGCKWSGFSQTK